MTKQDSACYLAAHDAQLVHRQLEIPYFIHERGDKMPTAEFCVLEHEVT